MRIKVFYKLIISAVVISAVSFGAYKYITGSTFRVHDIDVTLDKKAVSSFMFSQIKENIDSNVASLFGKHVWSVDLNRIIKAVEKDKRVKNVKIARRFPDTIQISILPHTPLTHILTERSNKLLPVSYNGEVLPAVSFHQAVDSVILRGNIFLDDLNLREQALSLIRALPESGKLSRQTVSEIYFMKKRGLMMRLTNGAPEIWMGTDKFSSRLQQAERVLDYLDREQIAGRIIDARFHKKVVVKLRNEP